jgi:hypothetical protein
MAGEQKPETEKSDSTRDTALKEITIIFSPEAEQTYKELEKQADISKKERMIIDSIQRKIEIIKQNCYYGVHIPKYLIPEYYKIKYGVNNLFRVELPDFWRLLYTVTEGTKKIEVIALVIDILNHKEYDKKFGYRKK